MKIESTHNFIKIYKRRFSNRPNIQSKFDERVRLFAENPQDVLLKDHPLSGKLQGFRAFSITGDVRVVYFVNEETAYLVDIGTHNQVYSRY